MLDKLMRLYVMAMAYDVRSPMPHIVGPPGCGKSTNVERLAEILDVNLHLVNVSRLSPLDVEGVQMPHGTGEEMILRMLPATYWSALEDGDIILFDEFLRGFPEVYNALLDIFTSRRVGHLRLPKVFMIGASNSVSAYDAALEDRLLHIAVADPRKRKSERDKLAQILVADLGLLPSMVNTAEMASLLDHEVLPMYDLLDSFDKKGSVVGKKTTNRAGGSSLRNLIGQAQLRLVKSTYLNDLIETNNHTAISQGKAQFVLLLKADSRSPHLVQYKTAAAKLKGNPKLTPVQALNLSMNLQLIELQQAMKEEDDE